MAEDADTSAPLERERFDAEKGFRERELVVREKELELKRKELASGWRNPLVLAIIGGTIVAIGNLGIAWCNGVLQRGLEEQRSEGTRILEMIKTGDPDKVAENFKFLLEAGLVSDPQAARLRKFLDRRKPGSGPALPTVCGVASIEERPDTVRGGHVGPKTMTCRLVEILSDFPLTFPSRAWADDVRTTTLPKARCKPRWADSRFE